MKRAVLLLALVACTKKEPPVVDASVAPANTAPPVPAVVDAHDVVEKSCMSCHTEQMLQQQRLTEAQWTKEVAKMTGWGANIDPSDAPALIAYLAANYGPAAGAYVATMAPVDELEGTDDGIFANGEASRGSSLFTEKCSGCHGADARGNVGVNLVDRPFLYRADVVAKTIRRGRGKMPPQNITDPDVADILAHLRKLR